MPNRMKASVLLPVIAVPLSVVLMAIADRTSGPGGKVFDFPYTPTVSYICRGISAPAALVAELVQYLVPVYAVDKSPLAFLGFGPGRWIFFVGVGILWHLVGRSIDHQRSHPPRKVSPLGILFQLSTILLGVALLLLASFELRSHSGNNPTGATMHAILSMVWSLVLIVVPGFRMLTVGNDNMTPPSRIDLPS